MKKELPVSITPSITSFAYYALPLCIIEAEDKIGREVASFEIKGCGENKWEKIGNWSQNGDKWCVTDDSFYGKDCNACLFHEISSKNDFIHIVVEKQRYSGPWGAINLFLTDNKENILLGDNEYLYRFGSFVYDGIHLYSNGKEQKIKEASIDGESYELVLNKKGNVVEVYGGTKQLKMLGRKEISLSENKELYIGIQVKHEDNTFYPWFYSNFISLSCDVYCTHRRLDYLALSKHWQFILPNYFLDINYYSAEEILDMGGYRYIKKCIDKQRYIELKVNQYYLKGREEYNREHHLHQNLIYGYDDKEKSLYLVGYQNTGKIAKFSIRYKDLDTSLKNYAEEKVKIITYAEDGHGYSFQSEYIKRMLVEYADGVNSSSSTEFLLPQDNRKYGLDIYEELMSEQGMKVFLSDRRVSYVLWEHKYHMKGRIKYLTLQGIYSAEMEEKLLQEIDPIIDICFNLRSMAQKYQMRPEKTNEDLLCKWLEEVRDREQILLKKMLCYWKTDN